MTASILFSMIAVGCKDDRSTESREHMDRDSRKGHDVTGDILKKEYRLKDFPIGPDVTYKQVASVVGPPTSTYGSGLTYYVYKVSTSEELVLSFDLGGNDTLDYAFIQKIGESDPMRRRVIYPVPDGQKEYRLKDFPIGPDVTYEQVASSVGPPTRKSGSGFTYYIYRISASEELFLLFDFGGNDTLDYAFVQKIGANDLRQLRVIYPAPDDKNK